MGSSICSAEGRPQQRDPAAPSPSQSSKGAQLVCETPEKNNVAACMGRDIDIIDGLTGKQARQLKGHTGAVTCLIVSNGALFSGSTDKTVKRWCTRQGAILQTMEGHTAAVWCLATANRSVYSAGDDCTIRHWNALSGECIGLLQDHDKRVVCLVANGSSLYSGSEDGTVRHWDTKSDLLLRKLGHDAPVSCTLSSNGSLFVGCHDSTIRRWCSETGELEATWVGGCKQPVRRVKRHVPSSVAGNSEPTLSGTAGLAAQLSEKTEQAEAAKTVESAETAGRGGIAEKAAEAENTKPQELVKVVGEEKSIFCLHAASGSASGFVFSGCRDGAITKWDIARNELVARLGGADEHELGVTSFLQQNDMILSGSADGTVRLWETDSGDLCNVLEGACGVTCLMRTSGGIIFGGQARGSPQRLPPLMRRRWWNDGLTAQASDTSSNGAAPEPQPAPETMRKFL